MPSEIDEALSWTRTRSRAESRMPDGRSADRTIAQVDIIVLAVEQNRRVVGWNWQDEGGCGMDEGRRLHVGMARGKTGATAG